MSNQIDDYEPHLNPKAFALKCGFGGQLNVPYRRRFRAGRQSIGDAARSLLDGLGMGDYDDQARSRRIFNELYAARFAGQVDFLGIRTGVVYLRVRDGSWIRRVKAFETQLLHDLATLGDLNKRPHRVAIKVGAARAEDP